jgi:hypothetical protein
MTLNYTYIVETEKGLSFDDPKLPSNDDVKLHCNTYIVGTEKGLSFDDPKLPSNDDVKLHLHCRNWKGSKLRWLLNFRLTMTLNYSYIVDF